jgi:hypothetical protein
MPHFSRIEIDNFLRISRLRMDLSAPIHIVAGHNEAGKTSLQEAMRFCLLGETERVNLKRDYKLMIKDGASSGEVRITLNDGSILTRDVATGRGTAEEYANMPDAVQYLLDATRYAWVNDKVRRSFMFALMGVSIKPDAVRERLMADHGVTEAMCDVIMPMLKAGFDAAHSFCRDKATEARGAWKAITGETYGAKKAIGWVPAGDEIDAAAHANALAEMAKAKKDYETALKAYGASESHQQRFPQGQMFPCPSCGETICIDNRHPSKPIRVLTEKEKAMKPMEKVEPEGEPEELVAARNVLESSEAEIERIRRIKDRLNDSDRISKEAAAAHEEVERWAKAADALAPSGIPAQLIAERIRPLNDRLRETAVMTGWAQVSVTPDMQILVDNRLYALQSESSQWRAQAAIAEAISAISNIGIVVLDRVDVLDLSNRAALIKWLMKVRDDHNNILLFGTFKEAPKLPAAIKVHWFENGADITQEEAA